MDVGTVIAARSRCGSRGGRRLLHVEGVRMKRCEQIPAADLRDRCVRGRHVSGAPADAHLLSCSQHEC